MRYTHAHLRIAVIISVYFKHLQSPRCVTFSMMDTNAIFNCVVLLNILLIDKTLLRTLRIGRLVKEKTCVSINDFEQRMFYVTTVVTQHTQLLTSRFIVIRTLVFNRFGVIHKQRSCMLCLCVRACVRACERASVYVYI